MNDDGVGQKSIKILVAEICQFSFIMKSTVACAALLALDFASVKNRGCQLCMFDLKLLIRFMCHATRN